MLEQKLGCAVECFSAPYGLIDRRLARQARQAGFRYLCCSRGWPFRAGDALIPRLAVHGTTTDETFRSILLGDRAVLLRGALHQAALSPKRFAIRLFPATFGVRAREEEA